MTKCSQSPFASRSFDMKIVVIGGSGLIGKKLVRDLRDAGQDALPASPSSGDARRRSRVSSTRGWRGARGTSSGSDDERS